VVLLAGVRRLGTSRRLTRRGTTGAGRRLDRFETPRQRAWEVFRNDLTRVAGTRKVLLAPRGRERRKAARTRGATSRKPLRSFACVPHHSGMACMLMAREFRKAKFGLAVRMNRIESRFDKKEISGKLKE
jgi:hypothetical protein